MHHMCYCVKPDAHYNHEIVNIELHQIYAGNGKIRKYDTKIKTIIKWKIKKLKRRKRFCYSS